MGDVSGTRGSTLTRERATGAPGGRGRAAALVLLSTRGTNRASDEDLHRRFAMTRDPALREELTRRYLSLARGLARRYNQHGVPLEDLMQVASVGLLVAIDRFDPERGVGFPAFAVPTILGELRRHFRDCTWSVHATRHAQERAMAISGALESLAELNGSSPTAQEIAQYLELSVEEVLDGLQAHIANKTRSLDTPIGDGEGEQRTLQEVIGVDDDRYELTEIDVSVISALGSLSDFQREIVALSFFGEMTQSEIAKRAGVSQMQISRKLRQALDELRAHLD
jgi:RNA polymerase sigma-B factor